MLEGSGNLTYEDIDSVFKTTYNHTDEEAEVIIGCTINQEEKRGFEICVLATGY